ncbi:L-seryl-tRNA(Sec) selenium transferase [Lichenibacterium ramalinae]|uniref:L-seryl-tRNA(Sec) selenium transferase n=1 Tax=Lichenibacterium ramalinae TaxID=2316527 RepID=UPI001AECA5C3|nr:L-seryl-tRNA(Sec) selenium transferase [Lichenibacterium ramalinae]
MSGAIDRLRDLPAVDDVLRHDAGSALVARFGRAEAAAAIRGAVAEMRAALRAGAAPDLRPAAVAEAADRRLAVRDASGLRPLFNLTGTVLHTNLGRAVLAESAAEAARAAMLEPVALEYDLATGRRGERDDHVAELLRELTGAEAATVVNNNAAAVLLVINTFAAGREAVVSRGELVEIGGSFRMPDIMAQAGARLREVGTTNRTHPRDYRDAFGPETGLVLKIHTSNYRIEGYTAEVEGAELAGLAGAAAIPFCNDLGSGTLVDLSRWGLKKEPTVREAVAEGADLVTFSGDKLLGGPQVGFVVGRRDAVARLNANPMKRALRVDKLRLAALEATLKLYRDPETLAQKLPTLRLLARPAAEIAALAARLRDPVAAILAPAHAVSAEPCRSQIGSGALPVDTIPSAGLAIRPAPGTPPGTDALGRLAAALRALPRPVVGRVTDGALVLDLRCLEDEAGFLSNLRALPPGPAAGPP